MPKNIAPASTSQDAPPHVGHTTPTNLRDAGAQIGALDIGDDDDFDGEGDDFDDEGDGGTDKAKLVKKPKKNRQNDDVDTDDTDDSDDNQDADTDGGDDDLQSDDEDDTSNDEDAGNNAPEISTLTELAEALEVDNDFIDGLELTFRADGEDVTVNLAELRSGYQRDANYRRQTADIAEQRSQMVAETARQGEEFNKSLVQTGQILQLSEKLIVDDFNRPEMHALRVQNPAEWSAKQQEGNHKIAQLRNIYAQVAQQYDDYHGNLKTSSDAERLEKQEEARRELPNLIPSWSDSVDEQLTSYLVDNGFTVEVLNQIDDAKQISIAYKAMKYDEMLAASKKTKQKIVKLPKVTKPGKPATAQPKGRASVQKAKARFKNSGSVRDAGALISEIID